MSHETLEKFGFPDSLICAYEHWSVLVRPAQLTAGAMVICANSARARCWPELAPAAFTELGQVTAAVEAALQSAIGFDRINYMMLMMVDPHVHFHVLPRYATPRSICGMEIVDVSWPDAPDLRGVARRLGPAELREVAGFLSGYWPAR